MAYKISSLLLARVFLISICLLLQGKRLQHVTSQDTLNGAQMKQPEWLIEHDHSVLIPRIGRALLPTVFKPHNRYTGSVGGNIGGRTGGTGDIPGGDDTFVPNPGFEVPIPGYGAEGEGKHRHP